MDNILKSREYYAQNKVLFNKEYNVITQKYINRNKIGCCSDLYYKYAPTSYQDFFDKYLADADPDFNMTTLTGAWDKGRSICQLTAMAQAYCDDINNPDITLEMCFDNIVIHTIIETFDGHIAENFVVNLINRSGPFQAEKANGVLDTEYGVDVVVYNTRKNNISNYIQIKPSTFFVGTTNKSLIHDRINAIYKEKKFRTLCQANGYTVKDMEYMVYDKRSADRGILKFLNINGKFRHGILDIIDDKGIPKYAVKDLIFKKIEL